MRITFDYKKLTIAATIALLVVTNISELWLSERAGWVAWVVAAALLILISKLGKLSFGDIGLRKQSLLSGIRWGALVTGLIILVMAVAYTVNYKIFLDSRYHHNLIQAAISALVVIPLRTVIIEELAFRGVLWASINRIAGATRATIFSSLLFGLWHIVPSLHLGESSNALGGIAGDNALILVGTVAATTLAGVVFCELRRRSDSLIAPILAHWAINGGAIMLAALAWER